MKKRMNIAIGVFFIVFSIAVYLLMRDYPGGSLEEGLGPTFFPLLLIIVLIFLSILLIIDGFIRGGEQREPVEDKTTSFARENVKYPVAIAISILLYLTFLRPVGFLILTPVLLFIIMKTMGSSLKMSISASLALTGLTYWSFKILLRVPIPNGLLGGW